ncbi:MAG: RNA-binding transcriptional accessory protein [Clostridia bacterium]|nr:RNA-binding transcriptional accessory protein [Clostridia bacterium]
MTVLETLAKEFSIPLSRVEKTVELIDEGNTIPFIARYRKEVTGSLDDIVLRDLNDRLEYLRNMEKRREEIIALIDAQGKLTDEIRLAVANASTLTELDDIYRPYRPHRKTRASVAKEKGLEPLAELILAQSDSYEPSIEEAALGFVSEEKEVASAEEALTGALDIIAESISDNASYRKLIREKTVAAGMLVSVGQKEESSVYEQYYDYKESLAKMPGHRVLAVNRGEKEDFLKVSIEVDRELIIGMLYSEVIENDASPAKEYIVKAADDSYDRLIAPSIEREIRNDLTDSAGEDAIKLFSVNLKNLLMQAPLKGKTVLGYDPGYRTGCKLGVVDKTGKVLRTAVIYPTKPQERIAESSKVVKKLIADYNIDVVAIGNGTASKESELFIAGVLREIDRDVKYVMVNEAGASVYSASKLGAEEFPDFDVTERSAVSIARRLQDPLAELVKIDPKSIGVGQYQHDMKQARLGQALEGVVEDCVNSVGVDLNTASYSLLSYISGISATAAKNIVKYREENGEFKSRDEILNVPKIGPKAFQQCAGFLRVVDSKKALDNTGVHPESYEVAEKLLSMFGFGDEDVKNGGIAGLKFKVNKKGMKSVAETLGVGEPTLEDIINELEKPGRDIRDSAPAPILRDDVLSMEDLKPDMVLNGTVRNVIDFGAFVDIGVHQDGLVHISQISDKYIKHPSDVLNVGDVVKVRVIGVDLAKKRISLSMKGVENG